MPISMSELDERLQELEGRTFASEIFLEQVISFLAKSLPKNYFVSEIQKIRLRMVSDSKNGKFSFETEIEKQSFLKKLADLETGFIFREEDLE